MREDWRRPAGVLQQLFIRLEVDQPNSARLVVKGPHVEHWLNGTKVVEYELWSDKWKAQVAASKFKAWPPYGMARTGRLGLQAHGDEVAFKNIKVRSLK